MRVLRFLVLAFGIMLPGAEAEAPKDSLGWSNTRWGMSPNDLVKLRPDFTIGVDKYGSTAGRLPDLTIAGSQFQVSFMFEGAGGQSTAGSSEPQPSQDQWRLVRVELRGPQDACYRVTEALLGKYGQPTKQESGFNLWVFLTTTVRQVSRTDCGIIYHPTENYDNL